VHWQHSPYTLPLLLVAAFAGTLALYAWLRRATAGASGYSATMACLAWWSLCSALQHAGADPFTQSFWHALEFLGVVVAPTTWLHLVLQYTGHEKGLRAWRLWPFAVMPVLTTLAVWTNPLHQLFWRSSELDYSHGVALLATANGPLFWLHTAYCYLFMGLGSVLLIQGLLRSPLIYRSQARSLLFAIFVPWLANVLYLAGLRPFGHLDVTPFAFSVSAFSFGWGLFRFGLLDLVPVARDAVIEGMADGVIVLDAKGRFLDMNPVARRLLGPLAKGPFGRLAADALVGWPDLMNGQAGSPPPEVRLGEGSEARSYEVLVSELRDRGIKPSGRLVLLHDVTERKKAEAALRRQNEYLAALLESSRVINSGLALPTVLRNIAAEAARLIGGDPGGIGLVRDGQVSFDHLWIRDHWDASHDSYRLGEGIAGLVAATGRSYLVNDIRADPNVLFPERLEAEGVVGFIEAPILDRSGAVVGVLDIHRKPGGPPFSETDTQLIASLARPAAIAIENAALYGALEEKKQKIAESLWAIEELYRNEQQMTQRLQELNLMKTNFMIVTSHEMRTPLTLLRGYIEALLAGYVGSLGDAQAQALTVCRRTVDRMIASFNDIIEMLQLDERRIALAPRLTDVKAAVRDVLDELKPFFERRGQHARLDAAAELPRVMVDPDKLRLVLANLIENAMKFTPDGGEVSVAIETGVGSIHLSVEDTGIGIPREELDRIFDEFYTGPDSLHHKSGNYQFEARGAGLGLAIARGHVEAHGGRVWAESAGSGKGSIFHVMLPIGEAGQEAVEARREAV
jgi:signal transduction histidine kinase